jgi:hypothetical protein
MAMHNSNHTSRATPVSIRIRVWRPYKGKPCYVRIVHNSLAKVHQNGGRPPERQSSKLLEEQKNSGYGNWQPLEHPDWLLLEINVNILIRPDQVDIALATIFSVFRSNSVLQMNMGQGKFIIVYIICGACFELSKYTADASSQVKLLVLCQW